MTFMAFRSRDIPVSHNIQFRDCIHRNIAGPTTDAVMAAVLGEYCAPGTPPIEASSLFYGVAQVLGDAAFHDLWGGFLKRDPGHKPNPMDLPDFVASHELTRELPPLADLARFDLAYALAAQPGPVPSVAPCCLPKALIRAHPEMQLRFQPNWRYLELDWPVHRLFAETPTRDSLTALNAADWSYLRVALNGMGVSVTELAPADFRLQSALRNGRRLAEATAAGRAIDPALDPIPIVASLVEAGAIMDAALHPAERPSPEKSHSERINP
jgi:hypothetical protein